MLTPEASRLSRTRQCRLEVLMYRIKVFVRYAEQGVLFSPADGTIKKILETNSAVRVSVSKMEDKKSIQDLLVPGHTQRAFHFSISVPYRKSVENGSLEPRPVKLRTVLHGSSWLWTLLKPQPNLQKASYF